MVWPNLHFCQGDCVSELGGGHCQSPPPAPTQTPVGLSLQRPCSLLGPLVESTWLGYLPHRVVPPPKMVQVSCLPCCFPPSPWAIPAATQDRPWGVRETFRSPQAHGEDRDKIPKPSEEQPPEVGHEGGCTFLPPPDELGAPGSWRWSGWSLPSPPSSPELPCPASEAPELSGVSSPCSLGVTQLGEVKFWLFISSSCAWLPGGFKPLCAQIRGPRSVSSGLGAA